MELTIVTFNVFGAWFHAQKVLSTLFKTFIYPRFTAIAEYFEQSTVDVLCFQEINSYRQLNFFKKHLPSFPYVYYKKYLNCPRGGVVIFSKLPFESIRYETYKKTGSYFNKSFVAHLLRRGCLIGKVQGRELLIINTHLTHNIDHDYSETNRFMPLHKAQLTQMHDILKKTRDQQSVILCGDFNIPQSIPVMKHFLEKTDLHDAFAEAKNISTYHDDFSHGKKTLGKIDGIYYRSIQRQMSLINSDVLFEEKVTLINKKHDYVSDHIALKATFLLR